MALATAHVIAASHRELVWIECRAPKLRGNQKYVPPWTRAVLTRATYTVTPHTAPAPLITYPKDKNLSEHDRDNFRAHPDHSCNALVIKSMPRLFSARPLPALTLP